MILVQRSGSSGYCSCCVEIRGIAPIAPLVPPQTFNPARRFPQHALHASRVLPFCQPPANRHSWHSCLPLTWELLNTLLNSTSRRRERARGASCDHSLTLAIGMHGLLPTPGRHSFESQAQVLRYILLCLSSLVLRPRTQPNKIEELCFGPLPLFFEQCFIDPLR